MLNYILHHTQVPSSQVQTMGVYHNDVNITKIKYSETTKLFVQKNSNLNEENVNKFKSNKVQRLN